MNASRRWCLSAAMVIFLAITGLGWVGPADVRAAEPAKRPTRSSCVDCHSNSRLIVQNKKLYDYYQGWKLSVHEQENVTCVDCHGGNPASSDKVTAHGDKGMNASTPTSPISYQNVPLTCAKCHQDVYDDYKKSKHFEHLTAKKQDDQGPNCVTCHGSVNTTVLNVTTVRSTCEKCHNDDTGNHPEIPDQAEDVLSQFLSVQRYYRYLALKGETAKVKTLFKTLKPRIKQLNDSWHTFDLDKVSEQTENMINYLKVQRDKLDQDSSTNATKK